MKRGILADRDVTLIVAAVGISALGDILLWIPLTLHIQAMTDSGIAVAALMIALWLPIVLLAPVAGLLVDRHDARRVLVLASVAQVAVAAGLALALDSLRGDPDPGGHPRGPVLGLSAGRVRARAGGRRQ